jgi:hypothetical protein
LPLVFFDVGKNFLLRELFYELANLTLVVIQVEIGHALEG